MGTLDLSSADFTFNTEALSSNELRVLRFEGHESISQPFGFTIELVSEQDDVDIEAQVGTNGVLSLRGINPDGTRYHRFVHGVIERFEQLSAGERHSLYAARLVPTVAPLGYRRNSKIFQKLPTPDIVKMVLQDGKVPSDWIEPTLHGSYKERDYCVQYQESDLHFVSRLLEEVGIFFFFEHAKDKDVLVLGDGDHAITEVPNAAELGYHERPDLYEEVICQLRAESAIRPGGTALRDYRFKQPSLDLAAKEQGDKFSHLEQYYFPGEYVDVDLGKQIAKTRLEEQLHDRNRIVCVSTSRALLPGYKFKLRGHRRKSFNQEYLILSVRHEGTQPQALREEQAAAQNGKPSYRSYLVCIPANVVYRPPRITPRPQIIGLQTALVVGPAGEEIHCDKHGRIKVKFHWDRSDEKDDSSSCWVRVSQNWGGMSYGGMFIPRIGQEVAVEFLHGDPDRPLVIGRVYNGENPLPYPLPDKKAISTIKSQSTPGGGGSNELRFDDTAGAEEVYLHAQFDMNTKVERDRTETFGRDTKETVGRHRTSNVGQNETVTIGGERQASVAKNETLSVGKDQSLSVGTNQTVHVGANQTVTVGGNQSTTITGNETINLTGSHTETITGSMTVSVNQCLTETVLINYAETVGAAMELTIGAAFTETVGAMKALTIGGPLMETIGASRTTQVGSNQTTDVSGKAGLSAGSDVSVSAGGGISEKAGKDFVIDAGEGMSAKAGKDININAGKKVVIVGADEIAFKAGSAELVLKKNGDISIKGNKITIKGDSDVVIKGSKIGQN